MTQQESQFFELESNLRGEIAEFVRLCQELGFDAKDRLTDLLFDAGIDIDA
ncbi:MAG: hypothetical protein AB1513_09825 [Pseudomonadota bacterium]